MAIADAFAALKLLATHPKIDKDGACGRHSRATPAHSTDPHCAAQTLPSWGTASAATRPSTPRGSTFARCTFPVRPRSRLRSSLSLRRLTDNLSRAFADSDLKFKATYALYPVCILNPHDLKWNAPVHVYSGMDDNMVNHENCRAVAVDNRKSGSSCSLFFILAQCTFSFVHPLPLLSPALTRYSLAQA